MDKKLVFGILGGFVAGALAAVLLQPSNRKALMDKIDHLSDDLGSRIADQLEAIKDQLKADQSNEQKKP